MRMTSGDRYSRRQQSSTGNIPRDAILEPWKEPSTTGQNKPLPRASSSLDLANLYWIISAPCPFTSRTRKWLRKLSRTYCDISGGGFLDGKLSCARSATNPKQRATRRGKNSKRPRLTI